MRFLPGSQGGDSLAGDSLDSPFSEVPSSPPRGLFNARHLWPAEKPCRRSSYKYWENSSWPRLPRGLHPGVPPLTRAEALLEKAAKLHQARAELLGGRGVRSCRHGRLLEEPLRTPWKTQCRAVRINTHLRSVFPLLHSPC